MLQQEKNSLSVIVPAFNEELAIAEVVEAVKKQLQKLGIDYEIIVVNDGSTDRTRKILEELKDIKVINHPYNKGYGASLKTGLKEANYEWILITDGDGTYPADHIPELIKYMSHYDMISGARRGTYRPFYGRPAKWILNKTAGYLCNRKIHDLNCGLRLFKKSIYSEFSHLFPSGFSFTTTLMLVALTNDYSVKFVPIKYYKRKGKSSLKPFQSFAAFTLLIIRMIIYFRPLRFLLPAGLLAMGIGGIYLGYQLIKTQDITDAPMMLTLTGLQIIFIGLIADLIVKSRK